MVDCRWFIRTIVDRLAHLHFTHTHTHTRESTTCNNTHTHTHVPPSRTRRPRLLRDGPCRYVIILVRDALSTRRIANCAKTRYDDETRRGSPAAARRSVSQPVFRGTPETRVPREIRQTHKPINDIFTSDRVLNRV